MAAQKHPGDSVILQAAVREADHTQMARLAENASPSCQTHGLTSPSFNFLLCGTHLTLCFRRATLNSKPQTARRGSTQSSVGGQKPAQAPAQLLPMCVLEQIHLRFLYRRRTLGNWETTGKQCGCMVKCFVYLHEGLVSMKHLEKGVSLFLPLGPLLLFSPPDNTLRNL